MMVIPPFRAATAFCDADVTMLLQTNMLQMKKDSLLYSIGRIIVYAMAAIGAFLFIYRMSTGTDPGTPVELHNPFAP